jgi:aminopeptidase N
MQIPLPKLPHAATIMNTLIVFFLVFGLVGCTTTPEPGAAGIGDPYYSELGNGGYDVEHYTIALNVEPIANDISGTVTITARATQSLSSLNLDLVSLTVDSVSVNGKTADYLRTEHELAVTPAKPLANNKKFTVMVTYHGSPKPISVTTSSGPFERGWFHAEDGTINVISEPDGAATWFPVNDHPRDKATYRFEITVPKPFMVAASGILRETVEAGEKVRYVWEMDKPMASYLAAINIGQYVVETLPGPPGVTVRSYFPPGYEEAFKVNYAQIPTMIEYFSKLFGPYPFAAYGVLMADSTVPTCALAGALEIQTMSTHCPAFSSGQETIIAHELAHQWFGDSVSLVNWQDIWLKEGLATYAEWLWLTRAEGLPGVSRIADLKLGSLHLSAPIGQPKPDDLYNHDVVYTGGALVYHALRLRVGDEKFFKILQTYTERYRYANASTDDFIALSEKISGQKLQSFFDSWLYKTELPGFK